jgi:hypothetical protein
MHAVALAALQELLAARTVRRSAGSADSWQTPHAKTPPQPTAQEAALCTFVAQSASSSLLFSLFRSRRGLIIHHHMQQSLTKMNEILGSMQQHTEALWGAARGLLAVARRLRDTKRWCVSGAFK